MLLIGVIFVALLTWSCQFNQTHSQMLQLQSQAIQSLQEQHGTMLAALMPVLPLLQAIPLHIESARNKITDILNKPVVLPMTQRQPPDQCCDDSIPAVQRRRSKRSSATFDSDNSVSPSNRKKARINNTTPCTGIAVPAVVINTCSGEFGSSLRGPVLPVSTSPSRFLRQETTTVPSPRSVVHHQTPIMKQVVHTGTSSSPSTRPSFVRSSKRQPLIPRTNSVSLKNTELRKGSPKIQSNDTFHPPPMSSSSGFATPSSGLTRPSVPASRALTRRLWFTAHKSREENRRQFSKPSTLSSSPQSGMAPARSFIYDGLIVPHENNKPFLIGPGCYPTQCLPGPNKNSSQSPTQTAAHEVSTGQPPNTPALRSHGQANSLLPGRPRKSLLAHNTASTFMLTRQQVNVRERRSPRVSPCLIVEYQLRVMTPRRKEGASFHSMIRMTRRTRIL